MIQFLQTTTGDDIRDFTKQLKNKLTRKYRRQPPKKSYHDYPVSQRRPEDEWVKITSLSFMIINFFVGYRIPETSPIFENVHNRINLLAAR